MQNKYLITKFALFTEDTHLSANTFHTAVLEEVPHADDLQYEDIEMGPTRENIIACFFLMHGADENKTVFINALKIPSLTAPTNTSTVFDWFNNQTPETRQKLHSFAKS